VQEPSEHRADVVRRLLERGLSVEALRALFPGWEELIARIAADRGHPEGAPPSAER
jgi:hypothetical protein